MKRHALLIAAATACTMTLATSAIAAPAGSWTVGVGAGYVMPTDDNGSLVNDTLKVDLDSDTRPTLTGEYFVADNIGIEVLAALPFHHDMTLTDAAGNVIKAKTQHLPPTVSLQYHFDNVNTMVKPFVGVGVNYTTFFKERIYLNESSLKVKDSVGVAGHMGVDFPIAARDAVRVDARYINIEPDVELNGNDIGTVDINPWVFGVSYIKSF